MLQPTCLDNCNDLRRHILTLGEENHILSRFHHHSKSNCVFFVQDYLLIPNTQGLSEKIRPYIS